MDARGSGLALASFSLFRGSSTVPRGQPPRRLRIGSPEPGDEQEGAWPRERLEKMGCRVLSSGSSARIERGEEWRHGERLKRKQYEPEADPSPWALARSPAVPLWLIWRFHAC